MKILFFLPALSVGGLERLQITLANVLARDGHSVTVMTYGTENVLADELDDNVIFVYKEPKKHFGKKLPYIRHKFYDDGMWETRATPKQLHDYYIGDAKYDVEIGFFRGLSIKTIFGGCEKNFTTISAEKSVGTQKKINTDFREIVVHRSNGDTRHIAWVHTDFRRAVGYDFHFKSIDEVREAYASFDKVVCVSQEAKQGFIETIGDTGNLTVIYNMLPVKDIKRKAEEKAEVPTKREAFHVVLVGRLLDSAKGQKRLIHAVSRLHDEGNSISLVLVGGGTDEKLLRTEIQDRHADDYISMTGNQSNPYPYIKEADLLVCASYFEGYNLTVAEALIIGTPVLSTDCSGPNEILDGGKYGMIVENSEDGLYKGLKSLLENPEKLEEYRLKTADRKDFFDERKILKSLENAMET